MNLCRMVKNYIYKAFGIIIESDFDIPEFVEAAGNPEVRISLGKAPVTLSRITRKGVKFQATHNEFLLDVDEVARFYVKEGSSILVDLNKPAVDKEVRLFLLGSALGALFLQRGLLPIHGSAVKFGNSASVFTGLSGAGKSSIATYFVTKGYSFLADDISVIDNSLHVIPGFPNLKIWKDIAQKLEIESENLEEIRKSIKKYHFPVKDSFFNEALPVKNIFIISSKNSPGYEYEELKGLAKFNAVKNNTYRYRFVGGLEKMQEHFHILNKLLPNIKVYRILRPQSPVDLEGFAKFLIETFALNE